MKKLTLLLGFLLTLVSCDIEDDGPVVATEFAEVTAIDLPEFFEEGKIYEIEVTYLLPTACHEAAGIEVNRGKAVGPERRDIYVVGVTTYQPALMPCDRQQDNLEKNATFSLPIDETEPYTFYLWKGVDENNQAEFVTVEVPVGAPDATTEN